jgi:hypothetical protein
MIDPQSRAVLYIKLMAFTAVLGLISAVQADRHAAYAARLLAAFPSSHSEPAALDQPAPEAPNSTNTFLILFGWHASRPRSQC